MKYDASNATGDAGEYYFGYWVSHKLQWPCRLLDVDLGIDAQVEALDSDGETTGNFIAVQIKAQTEESIQPMSLSRKHFEYWQSIRTPVLIVVLLFPSKKLFFHYVDPLREYLSSDGHASGSLTESDFQRLSTASKVELRKLAYRHASNRLRQRLRPIDWECRRIRNMLDEDRPGYNPNSDAALDEIETINELERKLIELRLSASSLRKKTGNDCGYSASVGKFKKAYDDLSECLSGDMDWKEQTHAVRTFCERSFAHLSLD